MTWNSNVHSGVQCTAVAVQLYSVRYSLFFPKRLSWNFCRAIKLFRPLLCALLPTNLNWYSCKRTHLYTFATMETHQARKKFELKKSDTTDKSGYIPINFTIRIWNDVYCISHMCIFGNSNRYIKTSILMIRSNAHFISMKYKISMTIGNNNQLPTANYIPGIKKKQQIN